LERGDQLLGGEILGDRGDQVGRVRHRPARIRLAIRKRIDGRTLEVANRG
jgi:hypothetical protein